MMKCFWLWDAQHRALNMYVYAGYLLISYMWPTYLWRVLRLRGCSARMFTIASMVIETLMSSSVDCIKVPRTLTFLQTLFFLCSPCLHPPTDLYCFLRAGHPPHYYPCPGSVLFPVLNIDAVLPLGGQFISATPLASCHLTFLRFN